MPEDRSRDRKSVEATAAMRVVEAAGGDAAVLERTRSSLAATIAALRERMRPIEEQISVHRAVFRAVDAAWAAGKAEKMDDAPD